MSSRSSRHEPAQRALGAAELPSDSGELARLLTADPAPEVRIAAARRCTDLALLVAAWNVETDSLVRAALVAALDNALSQMKEAERRRIAIAGIADEGLLVALALAAGLAETRKAAAACVRSPQSLRKLADAARNKDRGVAKLAQQRADALKRQTGQTAEADTILAQLEELAGKSGPILSAVIDLDRRWQALEVSGDGARLARHDAARATLQARFAREQEEQRGRAKFERRLRELTAALASPATPAALAGQRAELAALREEAQVRGDGPALAVLDEAEQRIAQCEQGLESLAVAEALLVEAEQLAAGGTVDHAQLPARWQALDRAARTAPLTRRFETALIAIERRRLALMEASKEQAHAIRQQVHGLLNAAEQALAAGQLQAARSAADKIKTLKAAVGALPKPTAQRLGRLVQQLAELERWESFGQHNARLQLCERAEALPAQALDAPPLALEVQKLRNEWKALDEQHAGVPKALWERFDGACEKAYAPAARHFAEQAAQRKQARGQRGEFISAAAVQATGLLDGPRDWRAIERWLRDTDRKWREGMLGSVEPRAWKKLDAQMKAGLAPLRGALSSARELAKAARKVLIAEAAALAGKATERDTPAQVKALQVKWQEQARAVSLLQRDERTLWEQFRAACDAVFAARQNKRQEEAGREQEGRRAREDICARLDQLARATGQDDQDIRKAVRELHEQWKAQGGASAPALRGIESRFKKAEAAVEAMLSARVRAREAAVWETLAAKERLCEELDLRARLRKDAADADPSVAALEKWAALPPLSRAWEKKMVARRDAALRALSEPAAAGDYVARIEKGIESRREQLLELELQLGLDSPAEVQQQRLALQVRQLRDRFTRAATIGADTAGERLLAWCAEPGIVDAADLERSQRIFLKLAQVR